MSIFNPLRIEVDMATSVIHSNAFSMHLDGLLYCSISKQFNNHERVMKELDIVLSKSHGVYHASQALFEKKPKFIIKPFDGVLLAKNKRDELNSIISKIKNSNEKNGVNFNKFFQVLGTQYMKIVFYAHGDAKKNQLLSELSHK